MVDLVDCSKENQKFRRTPSEFTYPQELLWILILIIVFDFELSSREIERKTHTDLTFMYFKAIKNHHTEQSNI